MHKEARGWWHRLWSHMSEFTFCLPLYVYTLDNLFNQSMPQFLHQYDRTTTVPTLIQLVI